MTNFSISYDNLLGTQVDEYGATKSVEDAFAIIKEIIDAGNYVKVFYVVQYGKVYKDVLPCRYQTTRIPIEGEKENEKN